MSVNLTFITTVTDNMKPSFLLISSDVFSLVENIILLNWEECLSFLSLGNIYVREESERDAIIPQIFNP